MMNRQWMSLLFFVWLTTGCTLTPKTDQPPEYLDNFKKSLLTKTIEENMSVRDYERLVDCIDTAGPYEVHSWTHRTFKYIFHSERIGVDEATGKPFRKYRLQRIHRWSFLPIGYVFDIKEVACRNYHRQWEHMDAASCDADQYN